MRSYRAGDTVEDVCRACKLDRLHSVIVVDPAGVPVRVQCDYCGSQHQFRGGPADRAPARPAPVGAGTPAAGSTATRPAGASPVRPPFPIMSARERRAEPLMIEPVPEGRTSNAEDGERKAVDLELLLRRIIREEAGVTPVVPGERWRGGTMLLKPGTAGLQERSWPIETLFHKIVMIRNRLRTLEQQINASDLTEDAKIKLQSYVTGCYGSLTSFNVLFADEDDQFKGSGGES
jgi:hypothetical protein